jgi:putative ABC transport system permease protein
MKALFGIPMNSIMVVMLVLLGVCLAVVVLIGLTNRTMLRLGLRNIPRRRDQSVLVVLGLMLSTLIITAAFTVGDSLDYSITRDVYDILRPVDETLVFKGGGDSGTAGEGDAPLVPMAVVPRIEERFAGSPVIEAFIPALIQRVPVFNAATRQSEPQMRLVGVDPERTAKVGGVRYADGRVAEGR